MLVPALVDLSKLSDAGKNDFAKKDVYNAKIKNIENKIPTNASLNAKISEVKGEITNMPNLATTTPLTAAESKIPSVSDLAK